MKRTKHVLKICVIALLALTAQVAKAQSSNPQAIEQEQNNLPISTRVETSTTLTVGIPLPEGVIFEGVDYSSFAQLQADKPNYTEKDLTRLENSLRESGILTENEKTAIAVARKNLLILKK